MNWECIDDLLDSLRVRLSYFDMIVDNSQRSGVERKPPGSANALPQMINDDQ